MQASATNKEFNIFLLNVPFRSAGNKKKRARIVNTYSKVNLQDFRAASRFLYFIQVSLEFIE